MGPFGSEEQASEELSLSKIKTYSTS